MQSEGNDNQSPRPNSRRNQKPHRQAQQTHDTQSDSNLPHATTPKPRKTPRQPQHGDRTSSLGVQSNRPPNTARSAAAATPSKPSYAGAAFHASPAPSSLPVPKFFSRSVPSANADAGLQAKLEREGDKSGSPGATLAPQSIRPESKSPLDMFFNADRQEKARLANNRSETPSKSRDMFMLELDEASSPASQHNTPVPMRRQPPPAPSAENVPSSQSDEARRAAQTQSLKAFLNITSAQADTTPPSFHNGSQQQASYSTPSQQQNPDLLYGNRNLSPLFHAARSPHNAQSPSQPPFGQAPYNNYNPAFNNPYAASPSKPAPPPSHPHSYQQYNQQPQSLPPSHPSSQMNTTNELQDMEDRMKRMLRMS